MEVRKQAIDLTDLAMGIIILGLVVSIGAVVLINYRDTKLTDLSTLTTNNETVTSGNVLTKTWVKSVDSCYNQTGAIPWNSTQYTVSIDNVGGGATVTEANIFNGTQSFNCTYTWYNTTSRQDYTLANQSAIGIAEYGNWFKIIVIVGVAAVVLALIFMAFGRSGAGSSESESGIGGSY